MARSPFTALTGRVGYAANDWLFYAKGGGALMHVTYTEDLLTVGRGATALTQIFSDNRTEIVEVIFDFRRDRHRR